MRSMPLFLRPKINLRRYQDELGLAIWIMSKKTKIEKNFNVDGIRLWRFCIIRYTIRKGGTRNDRFS